MQWGCFNSYSPYPSMRLFSNLKQNASKVLEILRESLQ